MKTFHFRLEKALRWREAQLDIEKSRAAAALARITAIQAAIEQQRAASAEAAACIRTAPAGGALSLYAGFLERDRGRSRQFKDQLVTAKKTLAAEMERLLEANRNLHLVEKLRTAEQARWHREFDRELGQFADEAFLGRQRRAR